jgi:hypothetical protein
MLAVFHHPTIPTPERPAPRPIGCASDEPDAPPAIAVNTEEPRTFFRALLQALGTMHT